MRRIKIQTFLKKSRQYCLLINPLSWVHRFNNRLQTKLTTQHHTFGLDWDFYWTTNIVILDISVRHNFVQILWITSLIYSKCLDRKDRSPHLLTVNKPLRWLSLYLCIYKIMNSFESSGFLIQMVVSVIEYGKHQNITHKS